MSTTLIIRRCVCAQALIFRMEIIKIKGNKKDAITCDPATLEGCNDKEKKFVEKMKAADAEKLKKELKRLQGMNGKSMKPELQATFAAPCVCTRLIPDATLQSWMARRINVLTKMTKEL